MAGKLILAGNGHDIETLTEVLKHSAELGDIKALAVATELLALMKARALEQLAEVEALQARALELAALRAGRAD